MDTTIGSAPVYCEVCGEREQEISTDHVGLCGACFADAARGILKSDGLGDFCCRLLTHEAGEWRLHTLCLEPCGSGHDHGGSGLVSDRAPGKDITRTRFEESADGYICPVCGQANPTSRFRCPCCGHTTDDHGDWTSDAETRRVPETLVHDLRMFGARSADLAPFQLLDELWAILRRHEMVPSS